MSRDVDKIVDMLVKPRFTDLALVIDRVQSLKLLKIMQGILDGSAEYESQRQELKAKFLAVSARNFSSELESLQNELLVKMLNQDFSLVNVLFEEWPIKAICSAMKSRVGCHTFAGVLLVQQLQQTLLLILTKVYQSSPSAFAEIIKEQDELGRNMLHLVLYNSRSTFDSQTHFDLFETMLASTPEEERFNLVTAQDQQKTSVIDAAFTTNRPLFAFHCLLKCIPVSQRLSVLTTHDKDDEILLFKLLSYKNAEKMLINVLPVEQLLEATNIRNRSGQTFKECCLAKPDVWKTIDDIVSNNISTSHFAPK